LGRTKREAFEMVKNLIETMADAGRFKVTVHPSGRGEVFEVSGSVKA